MSTKRLYQVQLTAEFLVRMTGSFGDDEAVMEWTQAVELWQGMLFHNPATMTINGESLEVSQWSFVVVPPGSKCRLDWRGSKPYVYNYFGFACNQETGTFRSLPQISELGSHGAFWDIEYRRALTNLRTTSSHVVSIARSMIWSVTEPVQLKEKNVYVTAAEQLIRDDENCQMKISEISTAVGLSQNQLCRLFVLEHGTTPKQYMRDHQALKAQTLLTTTIQPIKAVAAACGFPNLHHFNRFVRARLGASPRDIRNQKAPKDIFRVETLRVQLEKN